MDYEGVQKYDFIGQYNREGGYNLHLKAKEPTRYAVLTVDMQKLGFLIIVFPLL